MDTKTRNLLITAVIAVLVGGFAGYKYGFSRGVAKSAMFNDKVKNEQAMMKDYSMKNDEITMDMQNDSGQSGTAMVKEVDGKVVVTIKLNGGEFSMPQPAHIHTGSCPTPGKVLYPLTSVENGMSETAIDVTMEQLLAQQPIAINVHKSADEASVYTACGDIK